jgi:hypothetical protein
MDELERRSEPCSRRAAEVGHDQLEVVLVLPLCVPRLVQELHLGSDDRDPVGVSLRQLPNRERDPRVAPADPDPALGLVQEELALVVIRLPRLGEPAFGAAEEDLVDRELELLIRFPGCPASDRLVRVPAVVARTERGLVMAEDPDLEVLVLAGDLADE